MIKGLGMSDKSLKVNEMDKVCKHLNYENIRKHISLYRLKQERKEAKERR